MTFGFTHVTDVTPCPCGDPGTYMRFETTGPLKGKLTCWCGASMPVGFDDVEELNQFVARHGGKPSSQSIIDQLRAECQEIDREMVAAATQSASQARECEPCPASPK